MTIHQQPISIKFYTPAQWVPMWQLRFARLAENGIYLDPAEIPTAPEIDNPDIPEWDMDQIEQVYLTGGGGFWLTWQEEERVGYVGVQDLGGVIELRRMYVKAAHRGQGIGTLLVQALIDHCGSAGMEAVPLWTS